VVALCLIQFVDVMGVTVVVTALPKMLTDVGAPSADGSLVATGYAMFFGGLLMFGARLGDRLGHRRTILISLGVFAVGALLGSIATSILSLTAARCIQGAGAAGAVPSALTLLTTLAGSGPARGRAVAAWSAAGAAAGASGFVVGGVVTDVASWRLIFWGLLAVSAIQAAAVIALVPPDPRSRDAQALNLIGSTLLTVLVMLIVVSATLLGQPGYRILGAGMLVAAAMVGALFVVAEHRASAPLLPRVVRRDPHVRRGTVGAFLNTATTSSTATLITLYLQSTLRRTPLAAAATLLPFSILVIAGSAAAARLLIRHRHERVTAAGLGLIGTGIAMPLLQPSSAVLVGSAMAVAGLGIGLSSVAMTSLATDVPEPSRATASGLVNTGAQLGTAIGTALLLLLAAVTTGVPASTTGAPVIAWATAAIIALAAAAAFARLPRPPARTIPVATSKPSRSNDKQPHRIARGGSRSA
jgi:MFS family permease